VFCVPPNYPYSENIRPWLDRHRADARPTADFLVGYEDDGNNAAEHDPVNRTDVIGEDNVAAALQLAFVAGNRNF